MQIYSLALAVAGLVSRSARLWDPTSRRICDLDELSPLLSAASWPEAGLKREKEALARSVASEGLAARAS
jgi:hypothetical protein